MTRTSSLEESEAHLLAVRGAHAEAAMSERVHRERCVGLVWLVGGVP
jgi:hypothetical protein